MNRVLTGLTMLIALSLAACDTPVENPVYPDITFTHKPPIVLDVAEIQIVRAYQPIRQSPHVETQFPIPPTQAIERWAQDRLRAAGRSGVATVTILEASAVEQSLEQSGGLTGMFTTEQAERYKLFMDVSIDAKVVDERGSRSASARGQAETTRTAPEDVTMNEREKIWYQMTEKAIRAFDDSFSAKVRDELSAFVR